LRSLNYKRKYPAARAMPAVMSVALPAILHPLQFEFKIRRGAVHPNNFSPHPYARGQMAMGRWTSSYIPRHLFDRRQMCFLVLALELSALVLIYIKFSVLERLIY
jgi:hypothetical protein